MGTTVGSDEFRREYAAVNDRGGHADFVMSRRLLRLSKTLMRHRTIYLPPHLRGPGFDRAQYAEYLRKLWPLLRQKWQALKALEAAFAEDAPLGIWRKLVHEVYRIELPLESPQVRMLPEGDAA